MKRFAASLMIILTIFIPMHAEEEKILTPAEEAKQNALIAEFGDFAIEYSKASNYKSYTSTQIKVSKSELKNKKIQFEGIYKTFNDIFPKYMEDSGYSSKKYYYLLMSDLSLPVLAKRKSKIADLLGKLKSGAKIRVYGRVKQFKSKKRHGMMPEYFLALDSATVLEKENQAGKKGTNNNGNRQERRKNRPWRK